MQYLSLIRITNCCYLLPIKNTFFGKKDWFFLAYLKKKQYLCTRFATIPLLFISNR